MPADRQASRPGQPRRQPERKRKHGSAAAQRVRRHGDAWAGPPEKRHLGQQSGPRQRKVLTHVRAAAELRAPGCGPGVGERHGGNAAGRGGRSSRRRFPTPSPSLAFRPGTATPTGRCHRPRGRPPSSRAPAPVPGLRPGSPRSVSPSPGRASFRDGEGGLLSPGCDFVLQDLVQGGMASPAAPGPGRSKVKSALGWQAPGNLGLGRARTLLRKPDPGALALTVPFVNFLACKGWLSVYFLRLVSAAERFCRFSDIKQAH